MQPWRPPIAQYSFCLIMASSTKSSSKCKSRGSHPWHQGGVHPSRLVGVHSTQLHVDRLAARQWECLHLKGQAVRRLVAQTQVDPMSIDRLPKSKPNISDAVITMARAWKHMAVSFNQVGDVPMCCPSMALHLPLTFGLCALKT